MLIGKEMLKVRAIRVTGRGDLKGFETSNLLHFLIDRLTDGGEVVSFMLRPTTLYHQEDSWYLFLLEAESSPGP
jgi:hypothetical protein